MELTIEKLIYGGDGLARMPAGKAVFVPFVLPGERVQAAVIEEKPGFARARLEQVLAPAERRAQPGCPYFGECGGCHYQHATYEAQLEFKREILRETLARQGKVEVNRIELHSSPPWNYRNRTRLKVSTGPPFAIGYYRMGSHSLLPVQECPISSPLLNRALAATWKVGERGEVPAEVVEIEFFADAQDERMLVELTLRQGSRPDWHKLAALAGTLRAEMEAVKGVSVFGSDRQGTVRKEETPPRWQTAMGAESLTYAADPYVYRVSAGAFFQNNRFLTGTLLSLAAESRSGGCALDLYAGGGLFTLPLAQTFREVAAVEAAPFSFADLKQNVPSNVKGYGVTVEKFLAHLPAGTQYDYVVVDPPRGGLGEKVALALAGLKAPEITYVSCDPATLARDVRVLLGAGYEIAAAHLVDLFPQTFHIETVLHLKR